MPTFSQMPLAMAVAYAFLRERKSSVLFEAAVPLPGLAKSCSALPITRSTVSEHSPTVTSVLLCTTAGHRCCSTSVMLYSRAPQLRLDLETSPLSLLRRMPNQVAWKHRLCVNQRPRWSQLAAPRLVRARSPVVTGSSVLAVFLTRVHIVKLSRNCCVMRVASVDLRPATMRGFTLPWSLTFWARDVVWAAHSLRIEVRTGVQWISTGTHPWTLPSRQDDGNVRATALSRAVCVAVQVVAVGRVRW